MKNLIHFVGIMFCVTVFFACQKELDFEPVVSNGIAVGTLKSTSGNCLPSSVNGIYYKDTVVKSTNNIDVTVNITAIGNYIIKSDTIDGLSFIGIGAVTTLGTNTIKLLAEGKPTSIGVKTFTIKFGTSVCKIDVSVVNALPPIAIFTFTGSPGNCTAPVYSGSVYTAGTATTALHTVTVQVNVTQPGSYSVTTGSAINGLIFTATGFFNGFGSNIIILTASGTPTASGTFNYTVSNGAVTSCAFPVTVSAGTPPPNLDYIPMTTNSNWTNKITTTPPPNPDTVFLQVSPNFKTFGANSYKIFERKTNGTPTDSSYFRKNGGQYFQYISDKIGTVSVPINKEYMVLDSNLAVNSTWNTVIAPLIVINGFTITNVNIDSKIIAKGVTQTVQGNLYNNVIKVQYTYSGTVFGTLQTLATEDRFYSKGIGIIYSNIQSAFFASILTEATRTQIF